MPNFQTFGTAALLWIGVYLNHFLKIESMNVCCVSLFCFQVTHVEPWEKGSRKTAGQTGMCGGVSRSTCIFQFFCV